VAGSPSRHRLRETFEEIPELYGRARPLYPAEIFDDLVALAHIPGAGRLLEIGCGTGQATRPLAERGFEIVCVELGKQLAVLARRKLASFPKVEIVNAAFETWEPAGGLFDAVVAFTAFHWIDPEAQYEKSARMLRAEGALGVVGTRHVLPEGGDPFWVDVQDDYDAIVPSEENRPPPHPDEVGDLAGEIDASGFFSVVAVRRYLWDVDYTASSYIAVLDTYSGHRSIGERTRQRLDDRIRRRIEQRPGRKITKTYLATLNVGQRL
jgi:SAM-dependent methyltransferase